jgi:serine/threonine-protein kinase
LHQANRRTPESLSKSIDLFQAAIARDPDHALLHSGLADSYALLGIYGAASAKEVMPKARRAAERAIELEPDRSQAHVSLGCVRSVHEWDWEGGAKDFQRALELEPESVWALHWHATQNLLPRGLFAEAGANLRRAQSLDPLSVVISLSLGLALYFERRFEEAVAEFHSTLELEPLFPVAHLFLARALLEQGRHDEAMATARRALELSPDTAEMIANLGHVHAARNEPDQARAVLERLESLAGSCYVSPALIAQVHAALGDESAALGLLEQAARDRTADLAWVAVRPVFESLHGTPRFAVLLETMSLARPETH